MLLAHEFHGRKFMLPDRLTARDRDRAAREAGEDAPSASGDTPFPEYPSKHHSCLKTELRIAAAVAGTMCSLIPLAKLCKLCL